MKRLTPTLLAITLALTACEGPEGPEGPAGVAGQDGDDGTNGTNGTNGSNGANGTPGTDGQDGQDGQDGRALTLKFDSAPFPATDAQKRQILASATATVDGEVHDIAYHTLARTGDVFGGNTFGAKYDKDLQVLKADDGSVRTTSAMDFNSLLPMGDKLFMVTQFETYPGAIYVSELSQDEATGELTVTSTKPVDVGPDGLWNACAGSVSPWGTHLGSEEYPEDPWAWQASKIYSPSYIYGEEQLFEYQGYDLDTATWSDISKTYNSLAYGYITEVTVDPSGGATFAKHYAMGRAAFELAYVMPDSKTAYSTSDDTNQPLMMFVADTAGDLSAGTLYAARFLQTSPDGAPRGHGDLLWVDLGHATNAEVRKMIDDGVSFDDWWDYADPIEGGCPSGYTGVNISVREFASPDRTYSPQCLKIKPGMDKAASRLDTRRYAAYKGATTEFRKEEGFAFDPINGRAFVVFSEIENGMESYGRSGSYSTSYDAFGPDHVRVAYNECGGVYALDIAPDPGIGSDYVAQNLYSYVEGIDMRSTGTSYDGTPYENNRCSINGIANPDNVTVIPGYDVLIIGEDTGSGHQNDIIWAYDMRMDKLTRIQTTPYGSETTSPYWYPEINGWAYMTSTVQHPFGESDQDKSNGPDDERGYVGVVGPFPAMPFN